MTNKMRIVRRASVVLFGVMVLGFGSGCASTRIERLSGPEFMSQADQISQLSSFHWTSYIGSSAGRAYLEFGRPAVLGNGSRTTVFWAPLSELPRDIAAKIKAGAPPWTPWYQGTNRINRVSQ